MEVRDYIPRENNQNYYYMLFCHFMYVKDIIKKHFHQYNFEIDQEIYASEQVTYHSVSKEKLELFTNTINDSMLYFTERYIEKIHRRKNKTIKPADLTKLCSFAATTARSLGLKSLSERLKFTLCMFQYGVDFEKTDKVISSIITSKKHQPAAIMRRINALIEKQGKI